MVGGMVSIFVYSGKKSVVNQSSGYDKHMIHKEIQPKGATVQLSENSILLDIKEAFPKDYERRIRQFDSPSPDFIAGDDFLTRFPYFIETAVKAAGMLRSLTTLLDEGIDNNQILFDAKNEAILKRKFLNWIVSTEPIYPYLPVFISIRKHTELVSAFLRASEFIRGWLSKQDAYENGTLEVEIPKQLPFGGPNESWYSESFERTF
jgi:hypothetical protein